MRQRFEQQLSLGLLPISDIRIPVKSRDEMPPTVKALQFIFTTPALNEKVFGLLEEKICKGKKKTGRSGMDLWHILVLAVIRHATGTNWDRLHMMANGDRYVREIMGVHCIQNGFEEIEFEYQTILDNVSLLDEDLLYKINAIVVEAGQQLLKKKESEIVELRLKTDSYVLETNVHFPTDLNLLWDSNRKCLDTVDKLRRISDISGWRKIKSIRKAVKSIFRSTSQHVFKGKREAVKISSVKEYLKVSTSLVERCKEVLTNKNITIVSGEEVLFLALSTILQDYIDYADKFIKQIDRRLLQNETIPAGEKTFSIFEPHTEWITKGKLSKKVELGHLLLLTTDQHQLIVDYKIMKGEKDPSQVEPLIERLQKTLAGKKVLSHSFDKGFWSKENFELLEASATDQVVLPKRGKHTKADKQREGSKDYKQLRNQHSAVESNINMLEHHGLNRCMNKGLHGYKRCVGLSVLAYNLHVVGKAIQVQEKIVQEKKEKREKQQQLLRQAA
ncbi:MAG: ISNCY family transposase [Chitinophagaceae bacterium]